MKQIKTIFTVTGILFFLGFAGMAQNQSEHDSIVQIIAEAQGLQRVPPGAWPDTGTFWLMQPSGIPVPAPCPPQDANTPVYLLADGQYLVDVTAGQLFGRTRRLGSPVSATAAAVAQAEAVTNLISQVQGAATQRARAQQLGQQQSSSLTNFITGTNASNTGGLYLEITNVANGLAFLNLRGATNWVYAIWSTTDLLKPWRVETEVWPWDTNSEPFTVATAGRDNLFLKAEDWTEVDSNGDGVPDWWLWYWFGNLNGRATDLDIYGDTLLSDFENWFDPNIIEFSFEVTNEFVNVRNVAAKLRVTAGTPAFYSVYVNSTAATNWFPFTVTNLPVTLGATDGVYNVVVGLKGPAWEATETWHSYQLVLDRSASKICITNPAIVNGIGIVIKPYLQLQGWADKPLSGLSYAISNTAGLFTNQPCHITDQIFDTNRFDFTTNYFWAYDVPLAEQDNFITLRVADRAGNISTTNFKVVLDYTRATNPPVVRMTWPLDGMTVSGTNLTLRGTMSDETGSIVARVVGGNGVTNTIVGLVERNRDFWVENVPLNGISEISVQATDAAGNVTTTNFIVNASSLKLTLDTVPTGDALWQPTGNVGGHISDSTARVFVNGVQGTNNGDGTWSASSVPIYGTGTASFNVSATPASPANGFALLGQATPVQAAGSFERAPRVIVSHHDASETVYRAVMTGSHTLESTSSRMWTTSYDASLSVNTNGDWQHDYHGSSELFQNIDTNSTHQSWTFSPSIHNPTLPNLNIPTFDYYSFPAGPRVYHYLARYVYFWFDQPPDQSGHFIRLLVNVSAKTSLKLYTGGKAEVGNRNLLRLRCTNLKSYEPRSQYALLAYPWWNAKISPITKLLGVQMGTLPVGADGVLWQALPDNASEDVTVTVPYYRHYSVNVIPTKYKVNISLTTATTNANLETDVPEVCVGQKVTFGLNNLPTNQIKNMVGKWTLPSKYVNHAWQNHHTVGTYPGIPHEEYYGSTNYDAVTSLLENTNQTSCWFYNQNSGHVGVNLNLQFTNGQYVSVAAIGDFKVYRPQCSLDTNSFQIGLVSVESSGQTFPGAKLTSGDVIFNALVNSSVFSGQANWTQLINRHTSGDGLQFLQNLFLYDTFGNYQLDNARFYNTIGDGAQGSPLNTPITVGITNVLPFDDRPAVGIASTSYLEVTDLFKTYLMFNPDPNNSENIWVTLGLVNWGWSGYAAFDIANLRWVLVSGTNSEPVLTYTDAFPTWIDVYHNAK